VVTGMGKSGHIGGKIAATLASTGTPAFFMHPGEASHGDIGMITRDDAVLALSNSGETDEILTIVPVIKRLGVPLIAFTGNSNSALARASPPCIWTSAYRPRPARSIWPPPPAPPRRLPSAMRWPWRC
jgi:arabinose-5-phosphate isomerase